MIIFNIFSCHKIFYVFFSILFLNLNLINFPCHHPRWSSIKRKKTFFFFCANDYFAFCLIALFATKFLSQSADEEKSQFFFFVICFNNFFCSHREKNVFTKINKVDTMCVHHLRPFCGASFLNFWRGSENVLTSVLNFPIVERKLLILFTLICSHF